jgi:hypothetical protein
MGYTSEVFTAVVDSKIRLEAFVQSIKVFSNPKEQEVFSNFRWVHMENDIWAFVFYDPNIRWDEEGQSVWRVISRKAKIFGISYIFYRIGDDYIDTEADEYYVNFKKNYRYVMETAVLQRRLILDKRVQSVFEVAQ